MKHISHQSKERRGSTHKYHFKAKTRKTKWNLLHRRLALLPNQPVHVIKRKYQILQASCFDPLGKIPLPNQFKHPFPHRSRRLPRISLQEILCKRQFKHILPQKPQPWMPRPHMASIRPVTRRMLKRQVQQGIKLLSRIIIPILVGRLQWVPQGLLGFKQVFVYPSFIGIVKPRWR